MRRQLSIFVGLIGSSGCAIEPGHGFATIEDASISAALVPGAARDLGEDTILTNLGYQVKLTSASLSIDRAELQTLEDGGSGGAGDFDPANPPPGYSLCHSGHCHHESGRLVPYAEIQAELAGGGAPAYRPVAIFPIAKSFDLLRGELWTVDEVEPSRELPKTSIARAVVRVGSIALAGRVRAGPESIDAPFEAELLLSGVMVRTLATAIDRHGKKTLDVVVSVELGGEVFDDLPFGELLQSDRIILSTQTTTAAEILAEHLLGTEPQVTL